MVSNPNLRHRDDLHISPSAIHGCESFHLIYLWWKRVVSFTLLHMDRVLIWLLNILHFNDGSRSYLLVDHRLFLRGLVRFVPLHELDHCCNWRVRQWVFMQFSCHFCLQKVLVLLLLHQVKWLSLDVKISHFLLLLALWASAAVINSSKPIGGYGLFHVC